MKILIKNVAKLNLICLVLILLAVLNGHTQAVVSADKMNVLYLGVENPVSVAVAGVDAQFVNVKALGASIRKLDDMHYLISPTGSAREVILMVFSVNGRDTTDYGSFHYRVKVVPQPYLIVASKYTNGESLISIPLTLLKVQPILTCSVPNFLFDISYAVASFTLLYSDGEKMVKEAIVGNQIPLPILTQFGKINKPLVVTIIDIKILDSSGAIQSIPNVSFQVE